MDAEAAVEKERGDAEVAAVAAADAGAAVTGVEAEKAAAAAVLEEVEAQHRRSHECCLYSAASRALSAHGCSRALSAHRCLL